MFSLDSKLELWFLVFIQLFIAIICPLALYIGWGGDTPWVFTVFIFLFPLFTTEHYLCRSKKCKYFIGFFSISFFHFLSGFGLFTDIEYKTIVVILLINSIILSIPWVLYVTIKDTFKLHFALLFLSTTWLALEYLNAQINILTPWYNLGNSLAGSIQLIQWYEFTGVSGGTFWILLTNILLFYSFQMLLKNNLKYFFSGLALLLICFIVPPVISSKIEFFYNGEEREVLVIDTNNHKDTSLMRITFNELLLASKKYISDQTSYIVWPEGALGIEIDEDRIETSSIVRRIKQILVSDKTSFIGGLTLANDERLFNAA
ncbi:MAG: hypothetical protein K8H85_11170, partial [Cyclobacteriaceae bacterium]|nr:hypothetical protein [Cyclobacteriaceae bacterium]